MKPEEVGAMMVTEKQIVRAQAESLTGQTGKPASTGSRSVCRIIGILAVLLLGGESAFGQFLIQPMIFKKAVHPGKGYTVQMHLENLSEGNTAAPETLSLNIMELTQAPDGSWRELRPDDPNLNKAVLRSCRAWLTVPTQQMTVTPLQIVPFKLDIKVPSGTRGFYFAAIVATTVPRLQEVNGIGSMMNVEFLVPVILEVQSIPMPNKVELANADLEFQVQTTEKEAASLLTLDIANNGGTFSRLFPVVRLWGKWTGHWREIKVLKFDEMAIMPGVKLHLSQDVGRPLPSGDYRLEAFLWVDGRQGPRIQRDLQFSGDRRVAPGPIKPDAALDVLLLDPVVNATPGATRSKSITVANGSEEQINVEIETLIPEHMTFAVNGKGIRGEDLGCASWTTVEPAKFTMRGYSRRNLNVLVKMPTTDVKYPSYYCVIRARATYADGQAGGMSETCLCVQNQKTTGTPDFNHVLSVSELSPSRYLATATFLNTGDTHVRPTCQGVLTLSGAGGVAVYKRFVMSSDAFGQGGMLLPMESRTFSGVLDATDLSEGTYYLTAVLRWPTGPKPTDVAERQIQQAVNVAEVGGRKTVTMTSMPASGPQVIKL